MVRSSSMNRSRIVGPAVGEESGAHGEFGGGRQPAAAPVAEFDDERHEFDRRVGEEVVDLLAMAGTALRVRGRRR